MHSIYFNRLKRQQILILSMCILRVCLTFESMKKNKDHKCYSYFLYIPYDVCMCMLVWMAITIHIRRWLHISYCTHVDWSDVYHAQVVHETCPVLPDLRWGAAERLHSDFLTAVQFPHRPHHHMHRVKHQRWRELWKVRGGGGPETWKERKKRGWKYGEERQGVKGKN